LDAADAAKRRRMWKDMAKARIQMTKKEIGKEILQSTRDPFLPDLFDVRDIVLKLIVVS
jgi:hypothetical protein